MKENGCLPVIVFFGAAWLVLEYSTKDVTEEVMQKADACQQEAVDRGLGVAYYPKLQAYMYSENKIELLSYYRHMYSCLPKNSVYPSRYDIKTHLDRLESELGVR